MVKGSGNSESKNASSDQLEYWNSYAYIFQPADIASGFGELGNGVNEINTFITNSEMLTRYGITLESDIYGIAIIMPFSCFGDFDECKDFDPTGCGSFAETDVLINYEFVDGWTTDPDDYTHALVQTTALHEIGHAWGAHHVFTLPAFGDSFSSLNYMNDDSGRFVTRMDANTIRAHYPPKQVTDVGIFPFVYGNSKYADNGNYTSVTPTRVRPGGIIHISNFLVQNIGTEEAENVTITFYLSTDTNIGEADYRVGTVEFNSLPVDADNDLNASFPIPPSIPHDNNDYYIGAIVTIDGAEDSIAINNSFIIGRPSRTVITILPCVDDDDCMDGKPCTDDSCIGGQCVNTSNTEDPCAEDGDVNVDGDITPQDALLTFRHYLELIQLDIFQQGIADVNQDGFITPADALCIFRKYLEMPSCLDQIDISGSYPQRWAR